MIAALFAFVIFTRALKMPFGDVQLSQYLRRLGFYLPPQAWKHVLLGILLAGCTLSGMLAASIWSGRYSLDWSTISLTHILFSINPGVWEEFFYRGIIMFVLLRSTRSVKYAALIQIMIFCLMHIKGFSVWQFVNIVSVAILAVAFTFAAWKTRTLITSIVFHFLHDAFLFLPQPPGGDYVGMKENMLLYGCLWLAVGLALLLIHFAAERWGVRAQRELYTLQPEPAVSAGSE